MWHTVSAFQALKENFFDELCSELAITDHCVGRKRKAHMCGVDWRAIQNQAI